MPVLDTDGEIGQWARETGDLRLLKDHLSHIDVVGLVGVKFLVFVHGRSLFDGIIGYPAVFVPEFRIVCIPEPEPDVAVSFAYVHADASVLGKRIIV